MCGICGEINFAGVVIQDYHARMCNILAHRGPDDSGMVLISGQRCVELKDLSKLSELENRFEVVLGHRRLSIIDLSEAGHQPMCNEDQTIWIVFNGEIYNFQNLREVLEKKGHYFKSNSDTEVIIHAYEEWATDCLNHFRGMFAFAIWDSKQKQLFIARDRLGKKPLVYFNRNGRFAFASEIKALLQIPEVQRKVNNYALHQYLTYQYIPSPDSIFDGIKKLPPAHYLLLDHTGNIKVERYWRLHLDSNHDTDANLEELTSNIRRELEESVKLRLVSDVPLGAFLSGGVDSSLVVGIMAKNSGKPIKTFSIGFEEKDFDELSYAKVVANHFGTEHHEFIVRPNAVDLLPKLVWHYNEPFADSSAIPTYYVADATKDFVKVVLTGDAGDENFAGYPRYLRSKWVASFTKLPESVRKEFIPELLRMFSSLHWRKKTLNRLADFIERLSSNQATNYLEQIKYFNRKEKENIYSKEFSETLKQVDSVGYLITKFEESGSKDLIDQLLYVDINSYLPEDLLVKVDIATMANSLEARVPFLDHKFMELVAQIPSRLKLKGTESKFILKKTFKEFLPNIIFKRRKMGFGIPLSKWFRNELKDHIYEVLLDQRTLQRGYFRREGIERLLNDHTALRYDHAGKIWLLLFLEMWFRVFIDRNVGFLNGGQTG